MRIDKFSASGVHGFLDFNIKFNRDLTFLTGTNGSGKTSVINSIISLISPSLKHLADLEYNFLRVEFENLGKRQFVEARRSGPQVALTVSGTSDVFEFDQFEMSSDIPSFKGLEFEQQYYRELSLNPSRHSVLNFIYSLPTPMFLGLDRRAALGQDSVRARIPTGRSAGKAGRNIFGTSLFQSLQDALDLAIGSNRDTLIEVGGLSEELRREFLLRLLSVEPTRGFAQLTLPAQHDLYTIKTMRRDLETLPTILQLPASEVTSKVKPFLDLLENAAANIPGGLDLSSYMSQAKSDDPILQSVFDWSMNRPQLDKIRSISEIVTKYNSRVKSLTKRRDNYLLLLNKFLGDNKKTVLSDERGFIWFSIKGVKGLKSMDSLSSGEAQIFVILTHLTYNQLAQNANIFIIDEPELSLHVEWQEIFVESIQSANPDVQYILATHSPSIILEKTSKCKDLSKIKISEESRG